MKSKVKKKQIINSESVLKELEDLARFQFLKLAMVWGRCSSESEIEALAREVISLQFGMKVLYAIDISPEINQKIKLKKIEILLREYLLIDQFNSGGHITIEGAINFKIDCTMWLMYLKCSLQSKRGRAFKFLAKAKTYCIFEKNTKESS